MIKNDRQFAISNRRHERLQSAALDIRERLASGALESTRGSVELRAVEGEARALEAELKQYTDLRDGRRRPDRIEQISDIPRVLIQARIAAGLSQAQLASMVDMKEQQLQRYEADDYQAVSLSRLVPIAVALGLEEAAASLPSLVSMSSAEIWRQLEAAGVPRDLARSALSGDSDDEHDRASIALQAAARILDEPLELLASSGATALDKRAAVLAFKKPQNASERRTAFLAMYAQFIGRALARCATQPPRDLPADPLEFRSEVLRKSDEISLESILDYVLGAGVVVVPLAMPGGFHAALWREDPRPVIALNPSSAFESRWLFDLLHELGHLADPTLASDRGSADAVHSEISSTDRDPQEVYANDWANTVLFGVPIDELVDEVEILTQGRRSARQRAVHRVARRRSLDEQCLAFAIAFELSGRGDDWWSGASAMQLKTSPWATTQGKLLGHLDLSLLPSDDVDLVASALRSTDTVTGERGDVS
jgi:transcriptional regulator with XRE-family HTH domain